MDPERRRHRAFDRQPIDGPERLARWREWLVTTRADGTSPGEPGSVRPPRPTSRLFDPRDGEPSPVLLFVGRFMEVKRVPLLVRAYARARERFERRAPLVIWGGFPGEWEGEHPHAVRRRGRRGGIFFVGWRGHTDLPEGSPCADVMVAPSLSEAFGQVLPRGDGRRRSGDRDGYRRTAVVRQHRTGARRTAGWSRPTTRSLSRTRSSRP